MIQHNSEINEIKEMTQIKEMIIQINYKNYKAIIYITIFNLRRK